MPKESTPTPVLAVGQNASLANTHTTRAVLDAFGLRAKYALGQNFLVDENVLQKIITLAEVSPDDVVLEVGPGIGTLTRELLRHARGVVAIERDAALVPVLHSTCAPWARAFTLIQKDALDVHENDIADTAGFPGVFPNKLVANLPYAVAATVILAYFERFGWLKSATVMVQREVAERIAAVPGTKNYGAYTVKLRMYAEVAGQFSVARSSFYPSPHVDSTVLRLNRALPTDVEGHPLGAQKIADVCVMVDAAFASRRKTLANSGKSYFASLGTGVTVPVDAQREIFARAGIDPSRRGETLSMEEFRALGSAYRSVLRAVGA